MGQNFLIDENILKKILFAADLSDQDSILEIGPGVGSLTQPLLQKTKKVVAIEMDKKLNQVLEDILVDYENLKILNADVMKTDLLQLYNKEFKEERIKIVSNLPYYLTTPLLFKIFTSSLPCSMMVFMVQKEVGERIVANKDYNSYGTGTLSLLVSYYSKAEILFNVPRTAFFPQPEVDSVVVRLIPREAPAVTVTDEAMFFDFIKKSFLMRRKKIVNSLQNHIPIDKGQLINFMEESGISSLSRAENLSLQEFAKLFNMIYN